MKSPAFWDKRNALSRLLLPLSCVVTSAGRLRQRKTTPYHAGIPVICVGNLTVGGAGKTPVALAIGKTLKAHGISAFYLSRGYGGQRTEPLMVNPKVHTAFEVGDEPLLLARMLPTIVAKNRADGSRLALAYGAQAIIMDDGFQNPSLAKDLSLLVIDGSYGLGNGKVMPAGPLREPPEDAFGRAQGIIIVNPQENSSFSLPPHLPVIAATTRMDGNLSQMHGKEVVAFCGIARPEKFFSMLESQGLKLAKRIAFGDHHYYTEHDIRMLTGHHLPLVTTAKDAVRLPDGVRQQVTIIDILLEFTDKAPLDMLLQTVLPSCSPRTPPNAMPAQ